MASQPADPRPLSPHLQVWRWHATMASSILHRASGIANYAGAVLLAVWVAFVAAGPEAYAPVEALLSGPAGVIFKLAMAGFTLSLTYHLLNGVRHMVWDAGAGFDPQGSNARSMFIILASIVITAAIWLLAGGLI